LLCYQEQRLGIRKFYGLLAGLTLFDTFSNCSDWLEKSRPSKKATFILIFHHRFNIYAKLVSAMLFWRYVAEIGRANSLHTSA